MNPFAAVPKAGLKEGDAVYAAFASFLEKKPVKISAIHLASFLELTKTDKFWELLNTKVSERIFSRVKRRDGVAKTPPNIKIFTAMRKTDDGGIQFYLSRVETGLISAKDLGFTRPELTSETVFSEDVLCDSDQPQVHELGGQGLNDYVKLAEFDSDDMVGITRYVHDMFMSMVSDSLNPHYTVEVVVRKVTGSWGNSENMVFLRMTEKARTVSLRLSHLALAEEEARFCVRRYFSEQEAFEGVSLKRKRDEED